MRATPDNITELETGQVFVFGSNMRGEHAGGAARLAYEKFGAVWGEGDGLFGRSYAFPTLDEWMQPVSDSDLKESVQLLYIAAREHPELTFLLTKVGCGIAGIPEERMKKLFEGERPDNIVFPAGW